jgi:hypothetical protein
MSRRWEVPPPWRRGDRHGDLRPTQFGGLGSIPDAEADLADRRDPRKLHLRDLALVSLTGAICLAIACGTAKGNNAPPVGYGQLAVDLVDAPNPVDEIWVKITQVRAHSTAAGWTTVSNTTLSVDLLKLQTYAAPLGLANL